MVIADLKKTTEQKMDKSVQAFKADLGKVRTGRAHTGLLDHIMVDYYGTPTALNQVAKVVLIDGRTIGTEERRKELIKVVKHEAENARVAVRNLRRDAISQLKDALKKHEISENDERRALDDMQKATDRHIADIERLLQEKEKELLAV
jgi:ribosome recycling factor